MAHHFIQLFKYGLGGSLAFILTFSSTYILKEKLGFYYLLASMIGYLLGLVVNFIFQAAVTFKTDPTAQKFILFLGFQLVGLLLFSLLMFLLTERLFFFYLISLVISSFIVFLFNFALSKLFVFKSV